MRTVAAVITGLAHAAVCVPDIDTAVQWYADVLGFRVLSPPYRMEGETIERDMRELVPAPVVVTAAIVGLESGDHVIELVEYPNASPDPAAPSIVHQGPTHIGLVCDDIEATRARLEAHGVEFLTTGFADIARLRTAWFRDPWGTVFILMEKSRVERPYWQQYGPRA